MSNNELSTTDVLTDPSKDFCSIYQSCSTKDDEDEAEIVALLDNQYYTETDFIDFIEKGNYANHFNLTILSINIANLLSKLNSLIRFLNNISSSGNKPDIVILVETHMNETINHGYDNAALADIVPGYQLFHKGRKIKREEE